MAEARSPSCGSCSYWQAYPLWKGVGVCENTVSRNYYRGVQATQPCCEQFRIVTAKAPEIGRQGRTR